VLALRPEHGGVHFSGRHGAERTLLELAHELEQSRPFRCIQAAARSPREDAEVWDQMASRLRALD
jgi:hypothetical protein